MYDKSEAGTDGQKQNLACRHTMSRRRGGGLKDERSPQRVVITAASSCQHGPPSTIEAATHWESPKHEWKEDAPFGRETKMISPSHGPPSLRPSSAQTQRYLTADYPSSSRAPQGVHRKDSSPPGWWDVWVWGEASKEQMKDLYLSLMYIVFSFLSGSFLMLAEGAEVKGARLNSGISFLQ